MNYAISKKELDSPGWHEDVLTARQAKVTEGQAQYVTIDQVKKDFGK